MKSPIDIEDPELVGQLKALRGEGKLVPFVGAGLSRNAKPISEGTGILPDWKGFVGMILDELTFLRDGDMKVTGLSPELAGYIRNEITDDFLKDAEKALSENPLKLATIIRDSINSIQGGGVAIKKFEAALLRKFSNIFGSSRYTTPSMHKKLVRCDFPYILTSNYDQILSDADRDQLKHYLEVVSFKDSQRLAEVIYNRVKAIIHIHGFLDDSDLSLDDLVITHHEYAKLIENRHFGFRALMRTILTRHSVLYLGYGNNDPHVDELISDLYHSLGLGIGDKDSFVPVSPVDPSVKDLLEKLDKRVAETMSRPEGSNLPQSFVVLPESEVNNVSATFLKKWNGIMVSFKLNEQNPDYISPIEKLIDKVYEGSPYKV